MAGFYIWKRIRPLSILLQKGSRWKVGNGTSISLWFDNWLDNDPIASKFPHHPFSNKYLVVDLTQENSWLIPTHLPVDLQAFLLQSNNHLFLGGHLAKDTLSWQRNSSGILGDPV